MERLVLIAKWAGSSLIGHIVLYGIVGSIVMSSVLIGLNYSEGTLTFNWALFIVFISTLGGITIGALGWWFITEPMLRQRGIKR